MFISLHNRSAYSFGSSLIMPEELAQRAAELGMSAVGVTDLHGLYAAVPFQQACDQVGVKPIFGAEFTLAGRVSVTLLARNSEGYGNLCRLISLTHLRGDPLELADIAQHAEGLICLFNAVETAAQRVPGDQALSSRFIACREIFEENCFAAVALHRDEDVPTIRQLAEFPIVATCGARCLGRSDALLLKALSSVGTLTLLDEPHADKPEGCWHLRTPAEMQRLFRRRPDALRNTLAIAERCNVRLDTGRNRFPAFAPPDGRSAMEYLRGLCVAGCRRRYVDEPQQRGIGGRRPTMDEALQRLERELAVIDQVGYAEYFLVFHEIVSYCRGRGIATLARGSAADSLVCYALGVSHACPFRFDLEFDRFLNPERARFSKMADIDLDLPWDQRDEVVRWVYDRWGHDRVAMIGAANTFHARAAVAELGKVYGLPPHEVREATKRLRYMRAKNLPKAIRGSPEAREIPVHEEPYRTILRMAGRLDGLPRHWALHPCGLVVSPEPLTDLVPVQRSPKGPLVAQYEMDPIEDLGFIKIDLLGQAGLSVLRDAVTEIGRTEGIRIDLERDVDYSDAETWDRIATGNARGVHHIESPAMTSLIRQCNCRDIDCLTAVVAIIRPGAANQGKKEAFARRHQGFEPAEFVHPSLVGVLEQTYGLMVFEEHILQIAVAFAGMDLGRADVLRRALNKENRPLIAEMRDAFTGGARRLGRNDAEIDVVWRQLEGFAGFMFNKAHSAEYAVEAFQGAWLKHRWPAHYLAAVLSNYRGFYANSPTLPQILYVLEAMRYGVRFLPPCVNRSGERFRVERDANARCIRIPVTHIAGLSQAFLDRYLEQRAEGLFASPADFVRRVRPGEAEAIALLDAGALDVFDRSRPALFWELRQWLRRGDLLFGGDAASRPPIDLTPPDEKQIARRETELLGFPVTVDPLRHLGVDDRGREIDWSRYTRVSELPHRIHRRVTVCGLMVADRVNATTQGELMKFVTLGDGTGFVETHLFPAAYRRFGYLTVANPILAVTGVVEPFENGNGLTLRIEHLTVPARRSVDSSGGISCSYRPDQPECSAR